MRKFIAVLVAVLCGAFASVMPAHAGENDVSQLTFGAGMFDLRGSHKQRAEFDLQYRLGWGLFGGEGMFRGIKPIIGGMATTHGEKMVWGGLAFPLWFDGGRWEFEPSMAIGAYDKHGTKGLDLGGTREFHLGMNFSYRISDNLRLGAAITHISNAGSHRVNPGVNSALATFTWVFTD